MREEARGRWGGGGVDGGRSRDQLDPALPLEQDMLSRMLDSSAHLVILDEISLQFMFDVLSFLSARI